jgi:hypothetical protein
LNQKRISLRQAADFAWPAFKKHFGLFAAILLTFFGAWVILELMVIAGQRFGLWLWAALHLAFFIVFAGLEIGILRIGLALYDGRKPKFSDLFVGMALGPKFLVAQLLYLAVVLIGLVLLIVPGVYLGARFGFLGLVLVTGEPDLMSSFRRSAALSAGVTLDLMVAFMSLFLLNVLGACLLGVGLFITVPVSVLMLVGLYRQLIEVQ